MEHLDKLRHLPASDRRILLATASRYLNLWLLWVLTSVACGALNQFLESFWICAVLAVAQWIVLRRYIRHLSNWVFASILGGCIGFGVSFTTIFMLGVGAKIANITPKQELEVLGVLVNKQLFWNHAAGMFLMWTVVGIAQWLVLRNHIENTSWWLPASAVGGAVLGALRVVASSLMPGTPLVVTTGWFGYGAVTGIVMVWLLQSRIKSHLRISAAF